MIIILEGVNKTGKTTFLNMLEDKLNVGLRYYNRTHLSRFRENPSVFKMVTEIQLKSILEITPAVKCNIVFDRFHITERVYGKIDRNYEMEYFKEIDEELYKQGAKVIYFIDSLENINKRNGRDMTDYVDEFDKAMVESKLPLFAFNLKDITNEDKLKELFDFLEV